MIKTELVNEFIKKNKYLIGTKVHYLLIILLHGPHTVVQIYHLHVMHYGNDHVPCNWQNLMYFSLIIRYPQECRN